MTWTFGHPHDYFYAGIIVGVLFSMWVAVVVALFVQTRRGGSARDDKIGLDRGLACRSRINNRRQQHHRPKEG
jgi:hypothetical protein